jgi:hypothetical protein
MVDWVWSPVGGANVSHQDSLVTLFYKLKTNTLYYTCEQLLLHQIKKIHQCNLLPK